MKARLPLCSVDVLKIYFAGPLFTPYERSFIDECAAALRADGFEVFVPHEHELATGIDVTAAWIFAKDRPGIERADAAAGPGSCQSSYGRRDKATLINNPRGNHADGDRPP